MYPSAGARYALELYPVIFRSKDLPLGIYHYNVNRKVKSDFFLWMFIKKLTS